MMVRKKANDILISKLFTHMNYCILLFIFIFCSCNDAGKDTSTEKEVSADQVDQFKERRDKILNEAKLRSEEKAAQSVKNPDDWFWKNDRYATTVSKDNTLPGWKGGVADLAIAYMNKYQLAYFKIGTISADGVIELKLPETAPAVYTIEKVIGPQGFFADIQDKSLLNYTNKNTGFLMSHDLLVMRNEKTIGNLTLGNSVRVTHNLNDQGMVNSGDEGYLLFWVYAKDECSLKANQDWTGEIRKDGTNKMNVTTNVNYDLNFKAGWNLVKSEVEGMYQLDHERGLDVSWFKGHKHTVINQMPEDAIYFYRQ